MLALLMFVVGACGGGDGNSSSLGDSSSSTDSSRDEESSRPEESAEVSQEESREESCVAEETPSTEQTGNLNPLTGLADLSDEAVGKRPVAIVINNIKDSLPQYGIAGADIMFEMVAEAGITRLLAIWGDYTQIPNVCSVRS